MTTDPLIQSREPASKERLRLWLRLLKSTRVVEAELREKLRLEFASTLPRFDVMAALHRHPKGLKMSELSRFLMVSNGNVTGIVDRLTEEGFALREQVPGDRRAARARLTKKGIEEFARQAEAHEAWVDQLLAEIDPALAAELGQALTRISDQVEE
ncbi:MarR family transcriptional regulator [Roseobacter sp. HKCCD9010]|jgi:DNA-binding MarR family transcriptional regulator|uniref:MarR family winged helix-turn-helix transcriptional regulator n=1 Tax=unclassified Roseobacter TaxID=196798 RepID=UPI00119B6278|nr:MULTISPECIES: MarR family transcriptional regulator [unclassified Roseobacter]MBF9051411.1 MarR family transcriptional regulator [Rhodobacterales bacterium HKCCD4356]NNV13458.1 MarR family transcriptional regulator [Roseobacter sp. HKCCD7357]NNV17709.1 MarR family transcriptional regulator [Roseobacter sp. HKCCD8768]NNV27315.1 MarR family transcriptional regulator [Roseobacter sp. HKCCD8192]NNV31435.1 MarR family transcriptional regulator [Roseobacter sp. HKCCD9061]